MSADTKTIITSKVDLEEIRQHYKADTKRFKFQVQVCGGGAGCISSEMRGDCEGRPEHALLTCLQGRGT